MNILRTNCDQRSNLLVISSHNIRSALKTSLFGIIALLVLSVSLPSAFAQSADSESPIKMVLDLTKENLIESLDSVGEIPSTAQTFYEMGQEEYEKAIDALNNGDLEAAEEHALIAMALYEDSASVIGELEESLVLDQLPPGFGEAVESSSESEGQGLGVGDIPSGIINQLSASNIFEIQEEIVDIDEEVDGLRELIESNNLDVNLEEYNESVNLTKEVLANGDIPDAQAKLAIANEIKDNLYEQIDTAVEESQDERIQEFADERINDIENILEQGENLGLTKKTIDELQETLDVLQNGEFEEILEKTSEDSEFVKEIEENDDIAKEFDDSAPGNSENAPGQSNDDSAPGNSENAPGQSNDDSAPGNSENAPGQSNDDSAPGNSENAPGQSNDDSAPGNSENAPGQSNDDSAPGNSENAPGQSNDDSAPGNSENAPGQSNDDSAPGNSENAPGQSNDDSAPGNSENAPGQSNDDSAPGNSENAPGQSNDDSAPGNSENAPGQSNDDSAPGNSENAPGQSNDDSFDEPPGFGAAGDNPSDSGFENGNGVGLGNIPPGLAKKMFDGGLDSGFEESFEDISSDNGFEDSGTSFENLPPGLAKKFEVNFEQSPDDSFENSFEQSIDDEFEEKYDKTQKGVGNAKGKFKEISPGNSGNAPGQQNSAGDDGPKKGTVCHRPGTPAEQTKYNVPLNAHLGHGDTLGECSATGGDGSVTVTGGGIPDASTGENVDYVIDVAAYFDDVEDADTDMTYTGTDADVSGENNLIANNGITSVAGTTTVTIEPGNNKNGVSAITIRATDTAGNFVEDTFELSIGVGGGNDGSVTVTGGGIPDASTGENVDYVIDVAAYFDDVEDADTDMTYTGTDADVSGENNLIANNGITSVAGTTTVTIEPGNNKNGVSAITIRATDTAGNFVEDTFELSIGVGNTTPTVENAISDISITTPRPDFVVDLRTVFDDVEDADDAMTYNIQSNTFSGTFTSISIDASDVLTIDYDDTAAGEGTGTITIRATDSGPLFVEDVFDVTVSAAGGGNNAPTANAGTDQIVSDNSLVTLDGSSSSDPDVGDTITYAWLRIDSEGGNFTINNADTVSPTFTTPNLGNGQQRNYVIQLIVTDNHGLASVADTVQITSNG